MPDLRAAYPDQRLYLREDLTEHLLDRFDAVTLDAVLIALSSGRPELCERPLYDEQFLLATPIVHGLPRRKQVRKSDLAGQHLPLLEDGHCLRDQALEVCSLAGQADQDRLSAADSGNPSRDGVREYRHHADSRAVRSRPWRRWRHRGDPLRRATALQTDRVGLAQELRARR